MNQNTLTLSISSLNTDSFPILHTCTGTCMQLINTNNIDTGGPINFHSIRYFTTEQSSWRYDTSVDSVQVDCSIISSVSIECCSSIASFHSSYHWNTCLIRKVPLSSSPLSRTTWPPVSDALESSVGCSVSLPNLSDGNDTNVSIDPSGIGRHLCI